MATGLSRSKPLWFGVLAAPILWAVQLGINYQWEEFFACSPSVTHRGVVLGIDVRSWVLIVNVVVTAGALAALATSIRCWRRTSVVPVVGVSTAAGGSRRRGQGDTPCPPGEHRRDTAHWMALAGIANSVLFLLMIVAGFGPAVILKTCQTPL
jgi:hypothetical protein